MPKFRNISGQPLEIPDAGGWVDDDGVFTVSDDLFDGFACQPSNFAVVEETKPRVKKPHTTEEK